MPKVSICIPCYNNPEDVKRLLSSIEAQTYGDYEVVISDDSTNNEIEKLLSSENQSASNNSEKLQSRIIYTHNTKPLGPIFNWNAAIRLSSPGSEYIKIMFSDDWFTDENSLAEFVRMLDENPDAILAFSGSRQTHLTDSDEIESESDLKHGKSQKAELKHDEVKKDYDRCASDAFIQNLRKDFRTLFRTNQIGAPSAVIYRRSIASPISGVNGRSSIVPPASAYVQNEGKDIGRSTPILFDEQSGFASDVFLYMALLSANPVFAYTKDPLVCIGLHEHQYTETFEGKDEGIYRDYRLLFQKYQLWNRPDYTRFFLQNFLIPYHKGWNEARELNISRSDYLKEYFAEKQRTLESWLSSKTRKRSR